MRDTGHDVSEFTLLDVEELTVRASSSFAKNPLVKTARIFGGWNAVSSRDVLKHG